MLAMFLFLAAQDPARIPLTEVAARYAGAIDYRMEVRSSVQTDAPPEEPASKAVYRLAARLPRELRASWKIPGRGEVLLLTDGGEAWGYSERLNRFFAKPASQAVDELAELRRLHTQFFGRFANLDRMNLRVTAKKDSILVEPLSSEGWADELWIDHASKLVRKSRLRTKLAAPYSGWKTTTSVWTRYDLDTPVPDAMFRFQPPAKAREATAIEY
jgi:outer membrane lipoprotein-sorting protein